ncbi:DinB family protein [Branchiibius sp. NY16-3462-2]|uniref:DinB family protein n=1 Tax=Branchiibius sp. NY16-3462-2 TaxID=1807500 RepID=UPI000B0F5CBF|nr:DinB family protein [Branchiibius sp. NY16-3462-2]
MDWNHVLTEQLTFHWEHALRPRLDGMTDDEYFWEPVADCWSIRPADDQRPQIGSGPFRMECGRNEAGELYFDAVEGPAPVATAAWRLGHITTGVLGQRTQNHFAGPSCDARTWAYAGSAQDALDQLDAAYDGWVSGVRALGEEGLTEPCGPTEGPYAEYPMADLVTHIHREVIHHGAEVCLLRDLYAHR